MKPRDFGIPILMKPRDSEIPGIPKRRNKFLQILKKGKIYQFKLNLERKKID
jgi:hypothetical protein